MDRWVKWIEPFLECFGQHLRRTAVVEVDDDDRKEVNWFRNAYWMVVGRYSVTSLVI